MAVEAAPVTVGAAAVELTSTGQATSRRGTLSSMLVQAPSGAVLYVGPTGVTSATGFPIPAGQSLAVDLAPGEQLFGILATGSGTAYVLRTGV